MSENQNLALWNSVSDVPEGSTKRQTFGAKLHSIDGYHMFRRATELFGPVGQGWGWCCELQLMGDPPVFVAKVNLWYRNSTELASDEPRNTIGPVYGCKAALDGKGRPDEDAPKKATSDGIKKALSMLGFWSPVFLGEFDDDKYAHPTAGSEHKTREAMMDHNGEQAPADDGAW